MQQAAKRVTDGSTTARTAAAAADLGVACGQCHLQQGGPTVKSEPPPPEGMTLEQRMKRHAWATERLWEGIVVPSGDAWDAGSKALVHTPFPDQVLRRGAAARTAATDFDKLVTQASSRKTMDERAALYAGLLLTCGTCHRAKPSGT
jgi:cytochrome c553